jgi:uncharacterized protein DUF222
MADDDAVRQIDGWLARNAHRWSRWSYRKIVEVTDYFIQQLEPAAVRVARETDEGRHIGVAPLDSGMAEIWGDVRAPDAMAFDRRLDELATTVCPADPRTKAQRRADALSALAARATAMACVCGSPDCSAVSSDATVGDVVIHVLADAATVSGESTAPGYVPGFGGLAAQAVRELAASAKLRPLSHRASVGPRIGPARPCWPGIWECASTRYSVGHPLHLTRAQIRRYMAELTGSRPRSRAPPRRRTAASRRWLSMRRVTRGRDQA